MRIRAGILVTTKEVLTGLLGMDDPPWCNKCCILGGYS
jgi:hypothetical protein